MPVLDDLSQLAQIDRAQMLAYVRRLPEMATGAFARGSQVRLPIAAPRQILICGMGGSAISGDLARTLLQSCSGIPLIVTRQSHLPAWVDRDTLAIMMSYSGNTAETLGCLNDAISRQVPTVLVTSGGQFGALAAEHGLARIDVEGGWSPRAALGDLYFALLGVLSRVEACRVPVPAVAGAVARLSEDAALYAPEIPTDANPAKQLAERLLAASPVIFGVTPTTEAVAMRWKCQLNENSKRTVLCNVFPELTHNEIVNLSNTPPLDPPGGPAGYLAIVLRDPEDPPLLRAQLDIALDVMKANLGEVVELQGSGEDLLTRQLALCYLGDWVSVYLALAAGIDPTTITPIIELKDRMKGAVLA